ncbi:ABC transporter [Streptomyces sp. Ru62]|uniref:ABC transporter permease n=1 Tax=Streptomyces sp. Ru62 TaxID=2080745 RepID=UPI000CDE1858|nr:ABC transporter permease [Streptomyces sp. Ru62]POX63595.1 ABC transporter [Streptomyces sp. Ru62]
MALTESRAAAVTAHLLTSYRRTWLDSVFNSFLLPLCLLLGIGWSVGRHIGPHPSLGAPYFSFVGVGLLAASVVQIGAAESAWAVFGGFEWSRIYHAVRLTPARPIDILAGHLTAVVARATLGGLGFLLVIEAFGVGQRWTALLAVPLFPLFAAAIAAPVMAFSATIRNAGMFDLLFRLGIVPMAMFSGVYFPLDSLPAVPRAAALAVPLTHAVDVSRTLLLGTGTAGGTLVHLLYLAGWATAGLALARRAFIRRLAD